MTYYLSLEEILELHKELLDRFGGLPGVRDMGLLESSLMRPQMGYYETLSLQAAALLQSFVQNHVFIDGNKRVAFAAMAIFFQMNGYKIKVSSTVAEKFIIETVIKNKAGIEEIAKWLENHIHKIS